MARDVDHVYQCLKNAINNLGNVSLCFIHCNSAYDELVMQFLSCCEDMVDIFGKQIFDDYMVFIVDRHVPEFARPLLDADMTVMKTMRLARSANEENTEFRRITRENFQRALEVDPVCFTAFSMTGIPHVFYMIKKSVCSLFLRHGFAGTYEQIPSALITKLTKTTPQMMQGTTWNVTCTISPGRFVWAISTYRLGDGVNQQSCAHCRANTAQVPCLDGCSVRYCSIQCRQNHRESHPPPLCNALKHVVCSDIDLRDCGFVGLNENGESVMFDKWLICTPHEQTENSPQRICFCGKESIEHLQRMFADAVCGELPISLNDNITTFLEAIGVSFPNTTRSSNDDLCDDIVMCV